MPTELKKPILRRIGNLIVRLDSNGVAIRGYRHRTWRGLSFSRIAALADESTPIAALSETNAGRVVLEKLGASPDKTTDAGGAASKSAGEQGGTDASK